MIYFLIVLIFLSKVAFAFVPFVPRELGPVIFQHGIHPYVNIFLSVSVGSLLILKWLWNPRHLYTQSRFYRFSLVLVTLYLFLISFLQSFFVNTPASLITQMGAAFLSCFTIFLFGRVIPTSLRPENFLYLLKQLTVTLCWISVIVFLVFPAISFKGSRFIGVFKHIPYMVSCATLACFCLMYYLVKQSQTRRLIFINAVNFVVCFSLLILTGTRSALASVLFGFLLVFIIFPARSHANRIIKMALTITGLLAVLFFGDNLIRYSVDVATGQSNIGGRTAQDGVASRMEEMERGYEMFKKDQWLGQGINSKFSTAGETSVSNYNANKDPHNIVFSAGVIGGWGFVAIAIILLLALIIGSLKSLKSKNEAIKILAIYALAQVPILIIYHVHISIGGIADRIYWIVFGYIALKEQDIKKGS